MDILVVGDAHAKPKVSNRRFDWLAKYIEDTKPHTVIQMGDWFCMESLSSYDKGKKSFEGRRYKADIAAGQDAFERVKKYCGNSKFRPISLIGNHEERIQRAIESNAEFDGLLDIKDCYGPGWETYPFLHPVQIAGISFQHFFTTGVMGRAQAGEYPAANLIKKQFTSCVQGHTHVLDTAMRTDAHGKRIRGVVAGCFMDPKQWETYAGPANKLWWKGLVRLKNVDNGNFDLEEISIGRLQAAYGQR